MKYPQVVSMPSAVSDWLEEQLEARGIDAVVYTRYILSLLHTHTIDVIYPDDDLPYSRLNKEVRRQSSGSGRKRSRGSSSFSCKSSSSDWWRHAHVDAERIKRSAAVECLMSLSDQNNEIESLVDELCEKLNQVRSSSSSPIIITSSADTSFENISPQELAEKYYAAFPALKSQSLGQQPLTCTSVDSKSKQQSTPNKTKKLSKKTQSYKQEGNDRKILSKVNGDSAMKERQSKQRFSILSRNKNISATPRKSETFTDWSFSMFSNNNNSKKEEAMDSKTSNANNMFDQCVSEMWANEDNEMQLYEDLPVDIQELLDSPDPKSNTVEMMNLANMKNEGKSCFIPYGANIINSIWSNEQDTIDDNDINAAIDSESSLDFKFSSITINAKQFKQSTNWPNFGKCSDNETNAFLESTRRCLWPMDGFRSLPGDWKKAAETAEKEQLDEMMSFLTKSLMKLNHSKESSCFTEIIPRSQSSNQVQSFNPFGRSTSMFAFNSRSGLHFDREKEDLLTSERSHFKPISEKLDNRTQKQYADGATFVISNNLEKVDYKRSESGTMWLETGFGQGKKYLEYKSEDLDSSSTLSDMEFVLKFSICQNDKACQTEESHEKIEMNCIEEDTEIKDLSEDTIDDRCFGKSSSITAQKLEELRCICPMLPMEEYSCCPIHRPERSDSVLGELLWKYELKACEKCKSNNSHVMKWNNVNNWSSSIAHTEWESENLKNNLKNIWNGGEVCQSCLKCDAADTKAAPGTPQSIQNLQLREDISQDGEQLLSDLTNLQKSYMEELPLVAEMSCDISELLNASHKERKRRHSFIVDDPGCWSFASRLEEDCLIQMSTLPTIRSITL